MSAKAAAAVPPATAESPPKAKGKKPMLLLVVGALVLAGGAAGGTWYFVGKKAHDAGHEEAAAPPEPKHVAPTYMALENMVVNLADDGGERFAQVGITLELENEKAADQVKTFLPSVRNRVLMLVSQRSSEELLKRDGKEKLAADIGAEVSRALGYEVESPRPAKGEKAEKSEKADRGEKADEAAAPKKAKASGGPVRGVLFASFIVQ